MTSVLIGEPQTPLSGGAMNTPHLGEIAWDPCSELFLPAGLPGFEDEKRFIPIEIPAHRPLVFLQSAKRPEICFVSLPANVICPGFSLCLSDEDRAALLFDAMVEPVVGQDVLCLALLLPSCGTVMANLGAPIVINLHNSRCMQCVSPEVSARRYQLNDAGVWEPLC